MKSHKKRNEPRRPVGGAIQTNLQHSRAKSGADQGAVQIPVAALLKDNKDVELAESLSWLFGEESRFCWTLSGNGERSVDINSPTAQDSNFKMATKMAKQSFMLLAGPFCASKSSPIDKVNALAAERGNPSPCGPLLLLWVAPEECPEGCALPPWPWRATKGPQQHKRKPFHDSTHYWLLR